MPLYSPERHKYTRVYLTAVCQDCSWVSHTHDKLNTKRPLDNLRHGVLEHVREFEHQVILQSVKQTLYSPEHNETHN